MIKRDELINYLIEHFPNAKMKQIKIAANEIILGEIEENSRSCNNCKLNNSK